MALARDGNAAMASFYELRSWFLEGITDAESVEVVACRESLALASDLGLQQIRVASDCANAIKGINGAGMDSYGPIVQEINARARCFRKIEFVHELCCSVLKDITLLNHNLITYLSQKFGS